jgi:hypothetical protein
MCFEVSGDVVWVIVLTLAFVGFVDRQPADWIESKPIEEFVVGDAAKILFEKKWHHVVSRDRQLIWYLAIEGGQEALSWSHGFSSKVQD